MSINTPDTTDTIEFTTWELEIIKPAPSVIDFTMGEEVAYGKVVRPDDATLDAEETDYSGYYQLRLPKPHPGNVFSAVSALMRGVWRLGRPDRKGPLPAMPVT